MHVPLRCDILSDEAWCEDFCTPMEIRVEELRGRIRATTKRLWYLINSLRSPRCTGGTQIAMPMSFVVRRGCDRANIVVRCELHA